jgi:hypothetical protein
MPCFVITPLDDLVLRVFYHHSQLYYPLVLRQIFCFVSFLTLSTPPILACSIFHFSCENETVSNGKVINAKSALSLAKRF